MLLLHSFPKLVKSCKKLEKRCKMDLILRVLRDDIYLLNLFEKLLIFLLKLSFLTLFLISQRNFLIYFTKKSLGAYTWSYSKLHM